MYGNPSADPSAKLPRPAFLLLRELKFKTAASASFRGIDSWTVFLEVFRRSHGEFPRKLFVGVAWKCVVCLCWWAGHCGTMFLVVLAGESGTIFHDPIFHYIHMGWGSFSASAWTRLPKTYQNHCRTVFLRGLTQGVLRASQAQLRCNVLDKKTSSTKFGESTSGTITKATSFGSH